MHLLFSFNVFKCCLLQGFNSLSQEKILDLTTFPDDNLNVAKLMTCVCDREENIVWKKEKMLVTSIFSFSLNVFQNLLFQCHLKSELWVKGRKSNGLIVRTFFFSRNDLSKLEYLTQCIKEGLRMYSPVFWMQRQLATDTQIDGYHIPAGTNIGINVYVMHHLKEVWGEDHNEYKPERFSPENVTNMDPFQFMPFSAGQRYVA